MDPLIVLLAVVMSVLTVLLVIVGIQVILILKEVRGILKHTNHSLTMLDSLIELVSQSVTGLGTTLAGFKTGIKVAEAFVAWVKEHAPQSEHLLKDE